MKKINVLKKDLIVKYISKKWSLTSTMQFVYVFFNIF